MSHIPPVKADPGVNQDIILRRKREQMIVFRYVNEDGSDYDLGSDEFALYFSSSDKKRTADVLTLTIGDGLSKVGNEIMAVFTSDDSDIDRDLVFWQLVNLTTEQNWHQGNCRIITGYAPEDTTTEVDGTINLGDVVVETTITIAALMTGDQILDALTDADIEELYLLLLPYITGEVQPGGPSDYIGTLYQRLLPYITGEQQP